MRDFTNLNVVQKAQINEALDEAKATWQRQKPITDYLDKRYNVLDISEIGDYQIAKIRQKKGDKEVYYACFIDYKPLNEMGMTLDQAVLICLASKYNAGEMFPTYAARMLNANFIPEEDVQ